MRCALPLLFLASCITPDAYGPYLETQPSLGTGHDFIGVVGLEARYGSTTIGLGLLHPDSGQEQILIRLGFSLR